MMVGIKYASPVEKRELEKSSGLMLEDEIPYAGMRTPKNLVHQQNFSTFTAAGTYRSTSCHPKKI